MKTKVVAILFTLGVFGLAGAFVWSALRPMTADRDGPYGAAPTAAASAVISEGLLDMQVYVLGNLDVRLEIRFAPDADATASADARPEISFAMLDMHMDGLDPPLERLASGEWRARLRLPMAGRWVVSAGFGEERAEVEFDAR